MSFLGTFFKTRWRGFVIRAGSSPYVTSSGVERFLKSNVTSSGAERPFLRKKLLKYLPKMLFPSKLYKTRWRGFVIRAGSSLNPPGSEKTSEKLFKNGIFH
ncbi:hypothetical protein OQ279_15785 [Salinimicrobium sp. MT39]|uniref:Uncharacterized protein n=1 Tax=Salinimicrobium profundisediminis TaxID=2994553 RepID=A0A9X3CZG6_9FLAO|nr:hypothetical protein [Salinimicrobium profundisediminis]MCX2839608.1 hypothetical protein [Salinimicrobium profundisediminis]